MDPPPVVQLQLFEHSNTVPNSFTDITQYYPANFFVYVTLECESVPKTETARGSQAKAKQLTGTPNTGGLYLDRPDKAVFFTFGDLSVRSEGLYKLKFNLYEVPFCQHTNSVIMDAGDNQTGELGSAFGRAQVESNIFEVFSAKKFPGLAESTSLSRTLSEQGCKVRIRRDVRIRKHNAKDGPGTISDVESDNDEEESDGAQSIQQPSTPATARPRVDSSDDKQSVAGSGFSVTTPAQRYQPESYGQGRPQSSQSQMLPRGSASGPSTPATSMSSILWQHSSNQQHHPPYRPGSGYAPQHIQFPVTQPAYQYVPQHGYSQMPPPPPYSAPQTPVPPVHETPNVQYPGYHPPVHYGYSNQHHLPHAGSYTYAPSATEQNWSTVSNHGQQEAKNYHYITADQPFKQQQQPRNNEKPPQHGLITEQQQIEACGWQPSPEIVEKWRRTVPGFYFKPIPPPAWCGGPEHPVEDPKFDTSNFDWVPVEPPAWAKANPAGSKRSFEDTDNTTHINKPIKSGDRPHAPDVYEDDDSEGVEDIEGLRNTLVLKRADGITSTINQARKRYEQAAFEREQIDAGNLRRRQLLAGMY